MITASAILLVFLLFAVLMYLDRLPALLTLPLMAVSIAVIAGVPFPEIITNIVAAGSYRLAIPIITVIFGAILGQFMEDTGIARTMVRAASEFSSDRPIMLLFLLTVTVSLLFTVLGGLGAVIMVGTIVFPIMLSLGIPRLVAACSFLIAMSLGGTFNLVNWQLYISVLGLSSSEILRFSFYFAPLMFIMASIFIIMEVARGGIEKMCAVKRPARERPEPWYSLLTPFIPIFLVLGFSTYNLVNKPAVPFEFPIVTAIIIAVVYGTFTVRKKQSGRIQMLTKAAVEGTSRIGPAVLLMIGIGMLLTATTHPRVSSDISPFLTRMISNDPIFYVAFFGLLAPLALYRGPFNIWGMGAGLMGLLLATRTLTAPAIMAAFMSVGQIQGICDPTNTHNVWIANFLDVSAQRILRRTIPYVWALTIAGLIIAALRYL